jgi:hypothetical protein
MQRTLGAAIGKVVSKPSLFGRSLVEVSRPIALARAVNIKQRWIDLPVRTRRRAPRAAR